MRLSKAKRLRRQNQHDSNTINFNQAVKTKHIELIPKSRNQERYILDLLDTSKHIVIGHGPAGTGKTYLAMQAAIKAFRNHECERIVLTRPAVGVEDEKHGFLPGTLEQKMEPWTRPLFDILRLYYNAKEIQHFVEEGLIEISPLAFMRGRTFNDAWIVADEMQNATPGQVKMLMTRIGEHSKIVITGDIEQADKQGANNGLLDLCNRLADKSVNGMSVCGFEGKDIQRHPIIDSVLNLYS
jgi:phosphate starvation-inducible PhoH-like protein